jgi:hypothetical protein
VDPLPPVPLPRPLDGHDLVAVERTVRGARGGGQRLPDRVRDRLERSLGADLADVRVHHGGEADTIAGALGADAVAAGADIFLRDGVAEATGDRGLELLAHECAHVVQHAAAAPAAPAAPVVRAPDHADEHAAHRAAARARHGVPADAAGARITARPLLDDEALVLRRHASWEHRLLGDAKPTDLDAIAKGKPNRLQLLKDLRDFLWMWHQDPDSVTAEMIHQRYPYIRVLRLQPSNLLVTYGELNTLPDYFANPESVLTQPRSILLPILQAVRQEGYDRIQRLLGGSGAKFSGAVATMTGWDFMDLLLETKAIDDLTWNLGPDHTNHYTAVVARNACHFAPFSWYRWKANHLIARDMARRAQRTSDPALRAAFTHQAYMYNGYADHFLQDSFAAGHLVNKTLIMQWFITWAQDKWYVPVADWAKVKNMTTTNQPGLAARGLYDWSNPGSVRDPQTAEEGGDRQYRMDLSGVRAQGGRSQAQAYSDYLAFLNSTVVQSSSGALHDYFNAQSVWVTSSAHGTPYQLWGDDTMLNGGDGVGIAGETAHLSQQAIGEILATGATDISVDVLHSRFPTKVRDANGVYQPLETWNDGLRSLADTIFPAVHYLLLRAFPRIQHVSVDQSDQRVVSLANADDPTSVVLSAPGRIDAR